MEACIEEDRIMREMKTSMNTKRAYTTPEEKREYHKEYNQANKEQNNERYKAYYQANRELLSEKAKEPIECECGCVIKKGDLAKHKRTKKHLESINC
jgi:hypothetical protein